MLLPTSPKALSVSTFHELSMGMKGQSDGVVAIVLALGSKYQGFESQW